MVRPELEVIQEILTQEFTPEPAEGLNLPGVTIEAEAAHHHMSDLQEVAIPPIVLQHPEEVQVHQDLLLQGARVAQVEVPGLPQEVLEVLLPEEAVAEVDNNLLIYQATLQDKTCKVFL